MSALNRKILEEVKARYLSEIEETKELMASGAIRDFTEYRDLAGGIKGLRDATAIVDEVVAALTAGKE